MSLVFPSGHTGGTSAGAWSMGKTFELHIFAIIYTGPSGQNDAHILSSWAAGGTQTFFLMRYGDSIKFGCHAKADFENLSEGDYGGCILRDVSAYQYAAVGVPENTWVRVQCFALVFIPSGPHPLRQENTPPEGPGQIFRGRITAYWGDEPYNLDYGYWRFLTDNSTIEIVKKYTGNPPWDDCSTDYEGTLDYNRVRRPSGTGLSIGESTLGSGDKFEGKIIELSLWYESPPSWQNLRRKQGAALDDTTHLLLYFPFCDNGDAGYLNDDNSGLSVTAEGGAYFDTDEGCPEEAYEPVDLPDERHTDYRDVSKSRSASLILSAHDVQDISPARKAAENTETRETAESSPSRKISEA